MLNLRLILQEAPLHNLNLQNSSILNRFNFLNTFKYRDEYINFYSEK